MAESHGFLMAVETDPGISPDEIAQTIVHTLATHPSVMKIEMEHMGKLEIVEAEDE